MSTNPIFHLICTYSWGQQQPNLFCRGLNTRINKQLYHQYLYLFCHNCKTQPVEIHVFWIGLFDNFGWIS
uniref:Uncharacterized protein n=1 Tax=Tetranychus urticae TaxID=32264 RepID=T1K776_TETUR